MPGTDPMGAVIGVRGEQPASEITDAAVESVMNALMSQQVAIISQFNRPLRDEYMAALRADVRDALTAAFSRTGPSTEDS